MTPLQSTSELETLSCFLNLLACHHGLIYLGIIQSLETRFDDTSGGALTEEDVINIPAE